MLSSGWLMLFITTMKLHMSILPVVVLMSHARFSSCVCFCVRACVRACLRVCRCMYVCVGVCVCVHLCACLCPRVYVSVSVCVRVSMRARGHGQVVFRPIK